MTPHLLRTGLTAVALAASVAVGLAAPSSAAVPETRIRPAQLDRGPDLAFPHVDGKSVVDGDVRVPVKAGLVRLLGRSGDDYAVATSNTNGTGHYRTLRVSPDGDRTLLLQGVPIFEQTLSRDGTEIARSATRTGERTTLKVWSATDGHLLTTRRFDGSATILDFDEHRMVIGSWGPDRTFWWNVDTDTTKRIANGVGYIADIRADRFAYLTGDPYDDGCSVTARLSEPGTTVWRSCKQVVRAFAPSGGRMVTNFILSDGPGPGVVEVHRSHGGLAARYRAPYVFGALKWESARTLTLETYGTKRGATVRCDLADCERATRITRSAPYRVMPPEQRALRP